MLVKHLDHKNVVKQPLLQINIADVTTQLAQNAKKQASVAIVGALSDLIKHLRKCLQHQAEVSSPKSTDKWITDLQSALERCILQLLKKVCGFTSNFEFWIRDYPSVICKDIIELDFAVE